MNLGLTGVDIKGQNHVGGLVGYAEGGSITNCYTSGSVYSSVSGAGGIGGRFLSVNVSNSYSSCSVSSGSNAAGGFVGSIAENVTINRCYASGNVSVISGSKYYCGGFVGIIFANVKYSKVYDCYSTGNASWANRVGGFAGECNQGNCIYRCYSAGSLSGGTEVGGFIGNGGGVDGPSFFDAETDNIGTTGSGTNSGGATGKTTEEMKTLTTFTDAGWDFEGESANGTAEIWDMDLSGSINDGYPFLSWENGSEVALPVTLASFGAVAVNGAVSVTWITESETENAAFRLYRDEEMIAEIEGAGTTSEPHNYEYIDDQVIPGNTYTYVLADVSYANEETKYIDKAVTITIPENVIPTEFVLGNNTPNPFNPATTINFQLTTESNVELTVLDMNGRKIESLVNDHQSAGYYSVNWNASTYPSGIYLYRLKAGNFIETKKMVFMK